MAAGGGRRAHLGARAADGEGGRRDGGQAAARELAGRLRAKTGGGDPLDLVLDGLRDQGTEIVLRFTEGEPLHDELQRSGHLARLARWPNVAVERLPGPAEAHTLQVVRMQPGVHRALDAFLAAQVQRLGGAGV